MPRIDKLVLRLPAEFAGRGETLARAVAASLAGQPPALSSATLRGVTARASDAEIGAAAARALSIGPSARKGPRP